MVSIMEESWNESFNHEEDVVNSSLRVWFLLTVSLVMYYGRLKLCIILFPQFYIPTFKYVFEC